MITHPTFTFDAIGTHWVIDIEDSLSKEKEHILKNDIDERIRVFDMAYSRFREDSIVTAISRAPGRYVLPDDAEKMFAMYRTMYDLTHGQMTPLIGQTLVDAGYDAAYTLVQHKTLERPITWDDAITYSHPFVDVRIPVLLDFGACGKGYLIDLVGEVIEKNGVNSYCVDAGGDMIYKNTQSKPLIVGLEHPDMPRIFKEGSGELVDGQVIGMVSILNQSLCGSAGNRRSWANFNHIINPETLSSPRHIKAVWTISCDTITADALTTALYFVSASVLKKHFDFEYLILNDDNSFDKSDGFIANIFT